MRTHASSNACPMAFTDWGPYAAMLQLPLFPGDSALHASELSWEDFSLGKTCPPDRTLPDRVATLLSGLDLSRLQEGSSPKTGVSINAKLQGCRTNPTYLVEYPPLNDQGRAVYCRLCSENSMYYFVNNLFSCRYILRTSSYLSFFTRSFPMVILDKPECRPQ